MFEPLKRWLAHRWGWATFDEYSHLSKRLRADKEAWAQKYWLLRQQVLDLGHEPVA